MERVSFPDSVPASMSSRARKAMQLANQEAQRLHHAAVGLEHLLLGLVKEGVSPGAWALNWCGFTLEWLRRKVEQLHPRGPADIVLPGMLRYSDELLALIATQTAVLESNGALPLEPADFLAGLVINPPTPLIHTILRSKRLSWWFLRRILIRRL
jgi:ATP-dependent Clp protease ATP-binding subunit ClpA